MVYTCCRLIRTCWCFIFAVTFVLVLLQLRKYYEPILHTSLPTKIQPRMPETLARYDTKTLATKFIPFGNRSTPTPSTKEWSTSEREPVSKKIIVVETSGKSSLTARQACAVESGARQNPNMDILVHMRTSKLDLKNDYINSLSSFPNIRFIQLELNKLFIGSQLESWYLKNQWRRSPYKIIHLSDALRLLLLYLNGGIYMDLDVVVIKPLDDLRNSVAMANNVFVGSAVMVFDKGHFFLKLCLEEFAGHYLVSEWGHNGPELITKLMNHICANITNLSAISRRICQGVTLLPSQSFYPIPCMQWRNYFNEENPDKMIHKWKDSYLIHVWNKLSSATKVVKGSQQPYGIAARMFCPSTYNLSSKFGVF